MPDQELRNPRRTMLRLLKVGVALIVVYFGFTVVKGIHASRPIPFDAEMWRVPLIENEGCHRLRMSSDLVDRDRLLDLDSVKVIDLLGPADYRSDDPNEMRYWLCGNMSTRDDVLTILLGPELDVVATEIECVGRDCK